MSAPGEGGGLVERIAAVVDEHEWRWAIRDSRTGDGVRIACESPDCDWFAERRRETDDVWAEHTAHVAAALLALVQAEQAAALREAADEVRRVRTQGLREDEEYGPSSEWFEDWLHERADRIERLDHAVTELVALSEGARFDSERWRLLAKAEGVRLAQSYLREVRVD